MVDGIWSEQQAMEESAEYHSCPAFTPESHSSSHLLQLWSQEVSTLVQGKYDGKIFNKNNNNLNKKQYALFQKPCPPPSTEMCLPFTDLLLNPMNFYMPLKLLKS